MWGSTSSWPRRKNPNTPVHCSCSLFRRQINCFPKKRWCSADYEKTQRYLHIWVSIQHVEVKHMVRFSFSISDNISSSPDDNGGEGQVPIHELTAQSARRHVQTGRTVHCLLVSCMIHNQLLILIVEVMCMLIVLCFQTKPGSESST